MGEGDIEQGIDLSDQSRESYDRFMEFVKNPSQTDPPQTTTPNRTPGSGSRPREISFAAATTIETKDIDESYSSDSERFNENSNMLPTKANDEEAAKNDGNTDDDHGHHAGPTTISLIASSVVCFIIYFVFCIVFGSVVWDPLSGWTSLDPNVDPPFGVPQGVGINLMGIAMGSVFFAWKSGCKAIVGGPDLLPVVFFAEAGASVAAFLASQSGPPPCGDFGGGAGHRDLAGAGAGPCAAGAAGHRELVGDFMHIDAELVSQLVPTTLVAMMIGNAITGLLFYGLGKMKNTASVIGFIPASVVAGFLTCIGYKVIKLAVLITTGYSFKEKYIREIGNDEWHANDPWLPLLIAVIYGVLLYGLKHLHIVAAEKLIIGFIFFPLIIFFVICKASGISMQELRETDWFLTQMQDGQGCVSDPLTGPTCPYTRVNFWQTLQVAYGSGDLVAWGAIPRCIPIFIMGATMTSLDSMLKLTSSEKALAMDLDYNHEMKIGGKATILSSLFCGSPAYGQTKFNVINKSIARTVESSTPTLGLGFICLLVFLTGVAGPIINFMPRFLLGGLCVFAGVGFLWENLWEGRKNMNRVSFAIVWIIFLVNFIWEFFVLQNLPRDIQPMVPGLLVVFILGIVLSTFEFMFAFMHKAKPPVIRSGDECCSSAVRSEKHDTQLAVMSPWFQIFSVESFVFFGTANNLYQQLKANLAEQKATKPKAERTKYLIFDLTEVTGIDSSAKDVFFKVHRLLKTEGISLGWAMMNPKIVKKFTNWGLFEGTTHHTTLDLALRYVEDVLLQRANHLSQKWLVNPTVRKIFERQVLANVFNISVRSDEKNFSSARLMPWSEMINLSEGEELCGDGDDNLYMIYDGEVKIQGRDGNDYSVFIGSFFNLDRLLISVGALGGLPSTLGAHATKDCTLLVVSRKKFVEMQKEDGALTQKLLMTLIVQNESNRPGRVRPIARSRVGLAGSIDLDKRNSNDNAGMAKRLMKGDDYEISLTEAQKDSFSKIFTLILQPGEEEIPMEEFSAYVSKEAKALGSQISHKQFMNMIDDSGIDEDGDGVLTVDEFLHFLRGLFLADIPSSEIPALRSAYDAAVAEAPDDPMDEARVQVLFANLGFDVTSSGWQDIIGVIDADGDGDVDFSEFLTGIGMMKQFCLLANQLDEAFRGYKRLSTQKRRETFASSRALVPDEHKSKRTLLSSVSTFTSRRQLVNMDQPASEDEKDVSDLEDVELSAHDLELFLSIPREMAEEMVFLADQDEAEMEETKSNQGSRSEISAHRTIDREEFQQLIRSWS
mmetsp:Transcript_9887/g.21422  ORF Transcript_9887/g.21422 Transcript_9887/m.21422 type:complete len:1286 (+) Transcript_9887:334-4191(+)